MTLFPGDLLTIEQVAEMLDLPPRAAALLVRSSVARRLPWVGIRFLANDIRTLLSLPRKRCDGCGRERAAHLFRERHDSKDGRARWCFDCTEARKASRGSTALVKRENRNPSPARMAHLRRTYGIDRATYTMMVNRQTGGCAICGRTGRPLHVDHCHRSGQVRGLLCKPCNVALGHLEDSPFSLITALRYVLGAGVGKPRESPE